MKSSLRTPYFLLPFLFAALLTLRFALFAQVAGVEHDSGYHLGPARSLAERGEYTYLTNLGLTDAPITDTIHQKPMLQDEKGMNWLPFGGTVGAAFVVPEALVFKFFDFGWWQMRLLPLLFFFGLIFLLGRLVYAFENKLGFAIFAVWLWVLPKLTVISAFELFSEQVAFFYCLAGSVVTAYALSLRNNLSRGFIVAGTLFGLGVSTKALYALFPAAALATVYLFFREHPSERQWKDLATLAFFAALPTLAFELYAHSVITSKFGEAGWAAHNIERDLILQTGGSGSGNSVSDALARLDPKLDTIAGIGFDSHLLGWALVVGCCYFVLAPSFRKKRFVDWSSAKHIVLVILALKALLLYAWFFLKTNSVLGRHVWDGMLIAVVFVSIAVARQLRPVVEKQAERQPVYLLWLSALNLFFFDSKSLALDFVLTREKVLSWYDTQYRFLQRMPITPFFDRADQEEVMAFYAKNIPADARTYYEGGFLVSEMSSLVGRPFFALPRYFVPESRKIAQNFLIMGPYQIGPWPWLLSVAGSAENHAAEICTETLLKNNSYLVCRLRSVATTESPSPL